MEPDDEKVTRIPVRFKEPPEDNLPPMFKVLNAYEGCDHRGSYVLREGETEVECGRCKTRLDPMFVLKRIATEETLLEARRRRAKEVLAQLDARTRTKCEHCNRLTRIRVK
jgi:hypothetical protein